ncbi:MAG: TolB family protein [Thermoleophilia bacterium]
MADRKQLKPLFWFALPLVAGVVLVYLFVSSSFPSISGKTGNGDSHGPSISADGRFIAFVSNDAHILPGIDKDCDENGCQQAVYVYDIETGTTIQASVSAGGEPGNSGSGSLGLDGPEISADGESVIFLSTASNLVPDVEGGLFIKNLESGEVKAVSAHSGDEKQSWDKVAVLSTVSADGSLVAYTTSGGVFVFDVETGDTERVDIDTAGNELPDARPTYGRSSPTMSGDGRFIAFALDTDLPEKDESGSSTRTQIFVKDRQSGLLTLASTNELGQAADSACGNATISDDGSFVIFETQAANLITGPPGTRTMHIDTRGISSIYLKNLKTAKVRMLARGNNAALSADGDHMVFEYHEIPPSGSNFQSACGSGKNCPEIFIYDLRTEDQSLVVHGNEPDAFGTRNFLSVSNGGRAVAFASKSTFPGIEGTKCPYSSGGGGLGTAEMNSKERNCTNIFLKDMATGKLSLISREQEESN